MLFENVYDTWEVSTTNSEMPNYSVMDFKKNDLVLLETKLSKYCVQGNDKSKWNHQHVQFEILAISVLYSANAHSMGGPTHMKEIVGPCI